MKAPSVTSIRGTVPVDGALPDAERSLQWVDEVAALLPEESRLGWYRNVRPWVRMLPPDDEVAHLAYSMGYLALLTRNTPELIAAERVQLAALFHRLTEEMAGSVKTTAAYHQKLDDRLRILPEEIAQGLSPDALAAEIVDGVKEQFLRSGVSEAGRQLNEQGDRLRQLVSTQNHVLAEFRQQLNDSRSHVTRVLNAVVGSADSAKTSIDLWNHEMRKVQWIHLGLVLLIGVLVGALLYWWALTPQEVSSQRYESPMQLHQPPAPIPGKRTDMSRNDLVASWSERETKLLTGVVRQGPGQQARLRNRRFHTNMPNSLADDRVEAKIFPKGRGAMVSNGIGRRLLNVRDAAQFLGLEVDTVYKKSRLREVPCVKVGRALRFDVKALERFIEQHTIETID